MLPAGAVPDEERHRNGPAGLKLNFVARIGRRKGAAEHHAPLPVVERRLCGGRRGQGVELIDPPGQPGHRAARLAGPAPLVHRIGGRAHEEVRPLHAVREAPGELHRQLVRPRLRRRGSGIVARYRLHQSLLEPEPRRVRTLRAVVPGHTQRQRLAVVHRLHPHARHRGREPARLPDDLTHQWEPVPVHARPGRVVRREG